MDGLMLGSAFQPILWILKDMFLGWLKNMSEVGVR